MVHAPTNLCRSPGKSYNSQIRNTKISQALLTVFPSSKLPIMQDEIIPHLEPGRIPSTVDPDVINPSEGGKKQSKRPVRISAWKLAKLDSTEAVKAAAKARASSSILRPISSQAHYDSDRCSTGTASSRSSMAADAGLHGLARAGSLAASPMKSPYPPSRASREDLDTCPQTPSALSSPHQGSGFTSVSDQRHFNPIYQTSANRSPWSVKTTEGEEPAAGRNADNSRLRSTANTSGNLRSSVYWDQEAGQFVSSQSNAASSSWAGSRTELLYTGQSIFFGSPLLGGGGAKKSSRSVSSSSQQLQGGAVERGRGSQQLPIFVPRDSKDHHQRLP